MTPGVIEQWVWGIGASGNHLLYWPAFSESVFEGVLQFRANPSEGEGSGVGHYDASFAFRGLEQETDYFLVVRAQASGQDARGRPHGFTEYAWAFRTGRRDVTVTPGRLHVDLDGDPLSSGEMEFTLAMYDGPTGERFSASRYPGSGSVSLGDGAEVPAPFPAAARTKVGSSIVLSLWGMDDDSGLSIDLAGTGMHERHPGRGAAWEQRDGIETSTRNSAWVDREVLLTDSPGRHEQSFDLYTGGFTTIQYRLAMTVAHEVVRPTRRPKLVLKRYPYPDGWPNDVCPLGLEPLIP